MNKKAGKIAVYGATGHTGKFVVNELLRRDVPVIAVARDTSRLPAGVPALAARLDEPEALDRAFAGCAVVINCAGPFLDTAAPVVQAALRNGCCYLDVTAEQASAMNTFDTYDQAARDAGITIIPAASFYGGLADLLASALLGNVSADEIVTAIALDHWWPTEGTRRTSARNTVPRLVVEDGGLVPMQLPPSRTNWTFGPPFGAQPMVEACFSEVITVSRHVAVRKLRSYLNAASLGEVRDAATPYPAAIEASGKSAQRFAMEVVATTADGSRHRAMASGQDIYAVTAPIVVEAAVRLLDPAFARHGALALGQAFDAKAFLDAIAPNHLAVELFPA